MLTYDKTPSIYGSAPPSNTMSPAIPTTNGVRPPPHHRHIWIITGPAGCGKSTVAKYLAGQLQLPYIEGDEFHPKTNIDKMAAGIPLTDADRWDWLIQLREEAVKHLNVGATGVVVTCSALKKKYRDVIRVASYNNSNVVVHFVYLKAPKELLLERVRQRSGHYMKDSMVHSQFESLEEPNEEELSRDVLSVDVSGSMNEVQMSSLKVVTEVLKQDVLSSP
ncbi:P-loop containing nucleoside triphosphate hydrolase protein [Phyllosticta capitalensis]|uniref:Gluconokinase n=1 Tax=Phyllosticta capitalensis TaxID=121624 RepID=A0ABR1YVA1_9PEZI